jgi:SPP1 gp7 family putative phage head morphogenesis protein
VRIRLGGRSPLAVASDLHRASEAAALAAPDEAKKPSRAQRAIIRPRFRTLVAETKALAPKIEAAVNGYRRKFLERAHVLREAAGDDPELQRFLDALDAMGPAQLERVLSDSYEVMYRAGVAHVRSELDTRFDVNPLKAIAALNAYAFQFSTEVLIAEKAALKDLIRQAFHDGLDLDELAREIHMHFEDGLHRVDKNGNERVVDVGAWSQLVARTETARAMNRGALDSYAASGTDQVIWIAADDERTCPICRELDRTVANVGENFPGTDVEGAPIHPNCRCTVVARNELTEDLVGSDMTSAA